MRDWLRKTLFSLEERAFAVNMCLENDLNIIIIIIIFFTTIWKTICF